MSKFKLDFNIYSSKDRLEAVRKIPLNTLSKKELETVTNYILYGKDDDGTSIVDRKEVQIKTKFNSYQRNKTTSLEALIEMPTFDESIFQKDKTIYKKVKPQIDREALKDVPNMVELWDQIDSLQGIYDQNIGKVEKQEQTPNLNQDQLYFLNHQLISLKTQQYYLLDSIQPTIQVKKNKAEYHTSPTEQHCYYPILPRGLINQKNSKYFKNPRLDKDSSAAALIIDDNKVYFDFRNQEHLYQLIQCYNEILDQIRQQPDSILNNLIWTLDFYIEKANLSRQQQFIIECKKNRLSNREIKVRLEKELGISHKENYISTIWNKAVKLIIAAVELNYDEFLCKDYDKAWKVCSRCKKELLRDSRNFVKKNKSIDGLTNRCKKCDREIRLNKNQTRKIVVVAKEGQRNEGN